MQGSKLLPIWDGYTCRHSDTDAKVESNTAAPRHTDPRIRTVAYAHIRQRTHQHSCPCSYQYTKKRSCSWPISRPRWRHETQSGRPGRVRCYTLPGTG